MAAIVPATTLRAIAENQQKIADRRSERWRQAGISPQMIWQLSRRLPALGMFGGLLEHGRVLEVLAAATREHTATGQPITPEHLEEIDRQSWAARGFWHRLFV